MKTRRLTMAQALVGYLKNQYVERDGSQHAFFAGMLGIFGHGNVAGIGQALQENPDFPYIPIRNEQSGVHLAAGFAKASNRLRAMACTSSIGPGATNMVTGAALATINRLPVLLLPGDIFASRKVAPVLQQLESFSTQDTGVNDCFKPVSRYWDRIYRPEQLITALPEAMRVLTSPSDCGAVTLSLPQDVQAEAYDYPEELFQKRVWLIRRGQPDQLSLQRAVAAIRKARRPLIVAGGGVLMSEASAALAEFAAKTGIPVGETQAGKGSLAWDHPQSMGAIGATGTLAANRLAHSADLVIGVGTRYSDFTSASMTAFQNPDVTLRQHQYRRVRCLQGGSNSRCCRRAGRSGAAYRRAARHKGQRGVCHRDRRPQVAVGGRGGSAAQLRHSRPSGAELRSSARYGMPPVRAM